MISLVCVVGCLQDFSKGYDWISNKVLTEGALG